MLFVGILWCVFSYSGWLVPFSYRSTRPSCGSPPSLPDGSSLHLSFASFSCSQKKLTEIPSFFFLDLIVPSSFSLFPLAVAKARSCFFCMSNSPLFPLTINGSCSIAFMRPRQIGVPPRPPRPPRSCPLPRWYVVSHQSPPPSAFAPPLI